MTEPTKTAFLGLGTMGFPMAAHLARAGHSVTVYNRTAARAAAWADEHGGAAAPTPAAAANGAEMVFVCVGNDDDLRQVVLGADGAFSGMAPGAILVDHTTASAKAARELDHAARTRGLGFLDAPVSGGQSGAEAGSLTVMAGGSEAHFARARPVISAYARAVTLMGPAGCGQLTKMVNQICAAGLIQALAEGLDFAVKAGLDAERAVDVISKGAAQSWQMDNRAKTMLEGRFDFGFAVDWMRKDLAMCMDEARRCGAALPVTRLDTSSLITLLSDA
jgi:3-hydroxyisobutyrate dehydrogenase